MSKLKDIIDRAGSLDWDFVKESAMLNLYGTRAEQRDLLKRASDQDKMLEYNLGSNTEYASRFAAGIGLSKSGPNKVLRIAGKVLTNYTLTDYVFGKMNMRDSGGTERSSLAGMVRDIYNPPAPQQTAPVQPTYPVPITPTPELPEKKEPDVDPPPLSIPVDSPVETKPEPEPAPEPEPTPEEPTEPEPEPEPEPEDPYQPPDWLGLRKRKAKKKGK